MIYSNILERWYLFSTSGSEATRILGSCDDITHFFFFNSFILPDIK